MGSLKNADTWTHGVGAVRREFFQIEAGEAHDRADEIRVALRSQFNFFRLIILSEKPSDNATSRGYWRKH